MASTTNTGQQFKDKAKDAASTAKDTANQAADKASGYASQAVDKASEYASKAGDVASRALDKAGDYAHTAADRADDAAGSVGSGLRNLAGQVRDHAPNAGYLGQAGDRVAEGLEAGGRYLEDKGLSGMADDLGGLIRRNPIPAVLIGIGIGYLIACSTRSS